MSTEETVDELNAPYALNNELSRIMRNTYPHTLNGTFIEQLTPHQYTVREMEKFIQANYVPKSEHNRLVEEARLDELQKLKGQSSIFTRYIGDGKFEAVEVELIDTRTKALTKTTKGKL